MPTKSRSLRSLSRPDGRSRPREFASLIRCGCGGVPRWGPRIRAAQWGGREKTGAPTRLFLGLVARALSAPPLALGIFPSSGCSFLPGRGVAPRVAGARRVPLAGPVSSAPPPSTARGGLVGRSGPFRAGRLVAGASRLPNPLWCGLVLGPSLFRGAGRCRALLRCLWVAAQPVIIIFLPAGVPVCFCVLGPGVGFCLARSAFRPAPNGARVCVVGGVVVVVGPRPPVAAGPPDGTRPRQVWRVRARMQGARGPRGAGAFCINGIQSANTSLQKDGVHSPQRKPGRNRDCAGGWIPAQRRERPRRGRSRPPWAGSVRFQLRS